MLPISRPRFKYPHYQNYSNVTPLIVLFGEASLVAWGVFMLTQRFFKVWVVGEADDQMVEKLKEKLHEALARGERRIVFRFYLRDMSSTAHLEAMRPVLLENTLLSVVVEERDFSELEKDLASLSKEEGVLLLLSGRLKNLPELPRDGRLRVEEVGDVG